MLNEVYAAPEVKETKDASVADGGSLFESCGHFPCKTPVNKKTGIQFGAKWYHKECFDGVIIRSTRQMIRQVMPRALAMGMVRKLNRA